MIISINNKVEQYCTPRYKGQRITIAIDSSKSNSGIAIGDAMCELKDIIELNGEEVGTTIPETLDLCKDQRDFLKVLLEGSKPVLVGIEDIITKHQGEVSGMDIHTSRFKITAVFMSFISFFQDTFGITPILVNNQEWKSTVLPAEFRTRKYAKGSKAYLKSINSPLGEYTHDATDAACILEYLKMTKMPSKGYEILGAERSRVKFKIGIYTKDRSVQPTHKKYLPNYNLTLEQNLIVMANNLKYKDIAYIDFDVTKIPIDMLVKFCRGSFKRNEPIVRIMVARSDY